MTWFKLDCIDMSKPDATTPALVRLEDVSAIGPAQETATYQVEWAPLPTWKKETIRLVSLRNGQVFIVRGDAAARLEEALLGHASLMEPLGPTPLLLFCALRHEPPCEGGITRQLRNGVRTDLCSRHQVIFDGYLAERR